MLFLPVRLARTVLLAGVVLAGCADDTPAPPPPPPTEPAVGAEAGDPDSTLVGVALYDSTAVTITQMQPGDRSCYLTVRSPDGSEREEMADFAMCERDDLIGQPVALTRSQSMVLAASCEGDPECLDTEEVTLVIGADLVAERVLPDSLSR
jgi:hypothetical protein